MQLTAKLRNKSTQWTDKLKPRVGTVVLNNGSYYFNITGVNSPVSDTANWFKIQSGISYVEVNKTAANITGTDPNFSISLLSDGLPSYPAAFAVYVDINNTGNYELLSPVIYNPVTKVLSGLSSPNDFPDQKIKIVAV